MNSGKFKRSCFQNFILIKYGSILDTLSRELPGTRHLSKIFMKLFKVALFQTLNCEGCPSQGLDDTIFTKSVNLVSNFPIKSLLGSKLLPSIYETRPKPADGRQGLDWIVGPGYSFVVSSTNKTMETNQKP